jgi:anti-anti-sigma factor
VEVLACELQDDPPALLVRGEIDAAGAPALRAALAELREVVGGDAVVLDLSEVTFMDSSGLAALVDASSGGRRVEVRRPSPIVRRVIEMTGLDGLLLADR